MGCVQVGASYSGPRRPPQTVGRLQTAAANCYCAQGLDFEMYSSDIFNLRKETKVGKSDAKAAAAQDCLRIFFLLFFPCLFFSFCNLRIISAVVFLSAYFLCGRRRCNAVNTPVKARFTSTRRKKEESRQFLVSDGVGYRRPNLRIWCRTWSRQARPGFTAGCPVGIPTAGRTSESGAGITIAFRPRPSRTVPDRAGTKLRDAELESRAVGYLPEGRLGDYLAPERSMKCHGIVTEQSPPCHGAVSAQSHYNPRNSHGIITAWSLQGYNADRSRRPSPAVEGWVGGCHVTR